MKQFFFRSKKNVQPQPAIDDRQIFFLHIPKTAGISFTTFLCDHFDQAQILKGTFWEVIRKQPISDLGQFRLVTGHIGYEMAFYLNNPFIVTIFRHPVDRLCSVYEYLNQVFDLDPNKVHPDPDIDVLIQLWKVVVRRPFNQFLDSVEGPAVAALLRNPQARQLAQATPYVLSDLSDEQIFRLAKPRFDKIDVVGYTERFADTVAMTCRKTGWELPPDFDRYNQNITEKRHVRDTIDKATRKRIELMSEVDMELYHLSKKRLLNDLRQ